nr:zinc finger BED domain-containing protein RICESLEEPER 2-like [Tanacetum cinerariifolium]
MGPEEFTKFDILAWWKGRESLFPVLAAMARDLLSVQASTVASLEDGLGNKEQLHDVEVETGNTISLSDEEIALDEAASEASSSKAEEEDLTLEEALN